MKKMTRSFISLLAVIVLLLTATSGCIFPEEKGGGVEEYVLKAVIWVDKSVGYPNETITFDASFSKGEIIKYYWDFDMGDGLQFEHGEETMTHGYQEYGEYRVALKVVDKNGDTDNTYTSVYVNYVVSYTGNITLQASISHFFPLKTSAKSATIVLRYEAYKGGYGLLPNTNNLDLYIYYNETDDSEVANATTPLDPKATGTIEEKIDLSRTDLIWNLIGMRAEVKCKETTEDQVNYELTIEVRYNP